MRCTLAGALGQSTVVVGICVSGFVRVAAAATIFVTVPDQRIAEGPGCSLQEAIYSSVLHDSLDGGAHGVAIDATDPDHFIATECVMGTGNDTIVLPSKGSLKMDHVLDGDAHNPYGPTATPIIVSTITIEGNGATLEWIGDDAVRAFAVGTASIATPHGNAAGTGNLTLRNVDSKGFHVKGGDGGGGAGGGMGAGGAIYVQAGQLLIEGTTLLGCIAHCHAQAADRELKGKTFDEEACEQGRSEEVLPRQIRCRGSTLAQALATDVPGVPTGGAASEDRRRSGARRGWATRRRVLRRHAVARERLASDRDSHREGVIPLPIVNGPRYCNRSCGRGRARRLPVDKPTAGAIATTDAPAPA